MNLESLFPRLLSQLKQELVSIDDDRSTDVTLLADFLPLAQAEWPEKCDALFIETGESVHAHARVNRLLGALEATATVLGEGALGPDTQCFLAQLPLAVAALKASGNTAGYVSIRTKPRTELTVPAISESKLRARNQRLQKIASLETRIVEIETMLAQVKQELGELRQG